MSDNHRLVTPEVEDGIVQAYKNGTKLRDIEQQFGVARATVYWVLQRNKVTPNRVKPGARLAGDSATLSHLYGMIEAQDMYIKALEAELRARGGNPQDVIDAVRSASERDE